MLEEKGIVSPADGAKPREVFGDMEALTRGQREEGEEEEKEEKIDDVDE